MTFEDKYYFYYNQIKNCNSSTLASMYNWFNAKRVGATRLLPYCETIMDEILNPDNEPMSALSIAERYEHMLIRDLTKGTPTYGIDKNAWVQVYYEATNNINKIFAFWFYTNGLEGDEELLDCITADMLSLNEDNINRFITATDFEVELFKGEVEDD